MSNIAALAALGFLGLCFGIVIASGVVAFIISLGIVPRYAGITKTADKVRLYEDCSMLGAVLGNLLFFFQGSIPLGTLGLAVFGLFAGIFLGSWVIALGEVVNIFSIIVRRLGITKGLGMVIIVMALGKFSGALLLFWKGWWM
ncbi:MAG: stage V sporulation protein AB [Clostridia bacterium]|nr:stage V sporulation protein AB [Clostridia bacterium]NCC42858.1 stage V sporulation protein AB [Clostridia bacterium]